MNSIRKSQIEGINKVLKRIPRKGVYKDIHELHTIESLNDLQNLPFTQKNDIASIYSVQDFSLHSGLEYHASSGSTTGIPTIVPYSKKDIEIWKKVIVRILRAANVEKEDLILNTFTYSLFTGAWGFHYGAEKLGASIIPISSGDTDKQLYMIEKLKPTVLIGTANYILYLAIQALEKSVDVSSIKSVLCGSEPLSEKVRKEIETLLGADVFDNYGLSEVIGPGVSYECLSKDGLHINEDYFIPEVIDPKTLTPVEEGVEGELVLTSLTDIKPLLRFRTGDFTSLKTESCECGSRYVRMSKVNKRLDDLIIFHGVNFYPIQIQNILTEQVKEFSGHYKILIRKDDENKLDWLEILVGVMKNTNADVKDIQSMVKSNIGIKASIKIVDYKSLLEKKGKTKVFEDLRN